MDTIMVTNRVKTRAQDEIRPFPKNKSFRVYYVFPELYNNAANNNNIFSIHVSTNTHVWEKGVLLFKNQNKTPAASLFSRKWGSGAPRHIQTPIYRQIFITYTILV